MKTIKFNKGEDLQVFFSQNQYLVKNQILESVREGILNGLDLVSAFEIIYEDEVTYSFDIKKEEYEANLRDCLKYFEKEQEYEKCAMAQHLLSQVSV